MASKYYPSPPSNVAIRPLKGMNLSQPGQVISRGEFRRIKDFVAGSKGLYRRPGFTTYALGDTVSYRMVDMVTLWSTGGGQTTFLITEDFLYVVGPISGMDPRYWDYTNGQVVVTGLNVSGISTTFADVGLKAGDYFKVLDTSDMTEVTMVADSGGHLHGKYWLMNSPGGEHYAWYNATGSAGTGDPGLSGKTGHEVMYESGAGVTTMASLTSPVLGTLAEFVTSIGSSVLDLRCVTAGLITSHSDPASIGLTFNNTQFGASETSEKEVHKVSNNTALTLSVTLGRDYPSSVNYKTLRSFGAGEPNLVDWTVHRNELILSSIKTPLLVYDDASQELEEYVSSAGYMPSTGKFYANTVESFLDRVWAGYTYDTTDGYQRQRIRWSLATNGRDFSETTAYYDIPYTTGFLQRLVAMGRILVAYFQDALYFGTETRFPTLPLAFSKVETMQSGLVGPKAVVPYLDGHFAVMQDNIYYISSKGPEPIGNKVIKETINTCKMPWRVYAAADPVRERIIFGFPTTEDKIEKLWSFDYREGTWSYDEIETYMVANPLLNTSLTWADLGGATWEELSAYSWRDLQIDDPRRLTYVEQSGAIWKQSEDGATDPGSIAVSTELITADYDFDQPDKLKAVSRLSIKIEEVEDNPISDKIEFSVWGSVNKGKSYQPLGTLYIFNGFDEGHVDFELTGSTIRFKLTSSSAVPSYYITEMVMRVGKGGEEFDVEIQG